MGTYTDGRDGMKGHNERFGKEAINGGGNINLGVNQ